MRMGLPWMTHMGVRPAGAMHRIISRRPSVSVIDSSLPGRASGDCGRYYGCTGGGCTDPSPGVWCPLLITGLTISAISLPTIFQSAKSLIKMKRSGKLEWGAPTMCMLFTGLSAFFGYYVHFLDFAVGPLECQQEYHPDLYWHILSMSQSLFGMFLVLSVITILLMWYVQTRRCSNAHHTNDYGRFHTLQDRRPH